VWTPALETGRDFFMPDAILFVDGFNLYHALDFTALGPNRFRYRKYKWLDLNRLASFYLPDSRFKIAEVVFFTTIVRWDAGKEARHRAFVEALESRGVRIVEGVFKKKDVICKKCRKRFKTREEKRTDVNIAVEMLKLAQRGRYQRAIVVSGDTDLIPAFNAVRDLFPGHKISVVLPIGRSSHEMKGIADDVFQMTETQLSQSQLPDSITLPSGKVLTRPPTWI
jgi:uncharacterized LabA/DUF88 family protein